MQSYIYHRATLNVVNQRRKEITVNSCYAVHLFKVRCSASLISLLNLVTNCIYTSVGIVWILACVLDTISQYQSK